MIKSYESNGVITPKSTGGNKNCNKLFKSRFMVGIKLSLMIFGLMAISHQSLQAQCTTGANITTVTPLITWQTIAVSPGIPAYHHFPAQAGVTYTFTYCQGGGSYTGDTYLTISDNAPVALIANDDYCSLGSELQWTCPTNGIYRIYMSGCCPCSNAPTATLAYRGSSNPTPPPNCAGTPSNNPVLPLTYTTCPSISNPPFNFANNYSLTGVQYQWYSSTISPVGPFGTVTPLNNYDNFITGNNALQINTVGVTTWYQVVVTCTISQQSATISAGPVVVGGAVTNTVQYDEGFEGVAFNGRMPNCSWAVSNQTTCMTYTSAQSGNRLPRTGYKLAAFVATPAGTSYYYTNGIYLQTGITYSASMWYQSDLSGAANWSDLKISYGSAQSPTGLTLVAAVNGAVVSPIYKSLSNTFTVASTGLYFMAIQATGSSGAAQYLSWDDFQISIPCQAGANSPALIVNANNTNVCQGSPVNLNASGANSYVWNTGATTTGITVNPTQNTVYSVSGTNTLTGCVSTVTQAISVKPAPSVAAIAYPGVSCAGQPVSLNASGAASYAWSAGGTNALITVAPTTATSYTVVGTDPNGCSGTAVVAVAVNTLPIVTANASSQNVCVGDALTITGLGANTYVWYSSSTSQIFQGGIITQAIAQAGQTTYTVVGTDANNCNNSANVAITVNACLGLNTLASNGNEVRVYPNPNSGNFAVEFSDLDVHTLSILDLTGRVVSQITDVSEKTNVSINQLASGIYYLKVTSNKEVTVIKIIKD